MFQPAARRSHRDGALEGEPELVEGVRVLELQGPVLVHPARVALVEARRGAHLLVHVLVVPPNLGARGGGQVRTPKLAGVGHEAECCAG